MLALTLVLEVLYSGALLSGLDPVHKYFCRCCTISEQDVMTHLVLSVVVVGAVLTA